MNDQGNFDKNIQEFEAKGFISNQQRKFLEAVIQAGHATMHRSYKPTKKELISVMNIAESVVESVYINEHHAAALEKGVPKRKHPPKAKP